MTTPEASEEQTLVDTTAAAQAISSDPADPKALRRSRDRIRKWISRGQLPTYGTDQAGRRLVDLAEVYACDRTRRASIEYSKGNLARWRATRKRGGR